MRIGIYPGSFDPITYGHLDIIDRASKVVDKLIVAVLINGNKKSLFDIKERVDMIKECIKDKQNVEVESFNGLLVDFVENKNANIIIRGLRAVSDFEYELQLAQTNKQLKESIETLFLVTNLKYSYLSSSLVREVALFNGDISKFVTPIIEKNIKEKLKKSTTNS